MRKETLESYIEKRVLRSRNEVSDRGAAIKILNSPEKSPAVHALAGLASLSDPMDTASFLYKDTTMPVSLKGIILAVSYAHKAEWLEGIANDYAKKESDISLSLNYRRNARGWRKIAEGLARAAKKLEDRNLQHSISQRHRVIFHL